MKAIIIVHSYHHNNTRKIADSMAEALRAEVRSTSEISPTEAAKYDLIGFGAGIDSGKHYKPLLNFAKAMPNGNGKKHSFFQQRESLEKKRKNSATIAHCASSFKQKDTMF